MKARFLALALFGSLMLAFGAIAAGCDDTGDGGGDGLTLEEYFQRVDELDNELTEQSDALFAPLEDVQDPDEATDRLREIVPQQGALLQDFRDGLGDLDPPSEVEELHNDVLEAFDELIAGFGDIVGQLDGIESFEDLDALFTDSEFAAADERLTQVCLDAERLAADNEIAVDLNCGEDE